eukprot:COSAG01_NODE_47975_length_385_cov_0.881119_1_plen_42_part_00
MAMDYSNRARAPMVVVEIVTDFRVCAQQLVADLCAPWGPLA